MYSSSASRLTSASRRPWAEAISSRAARAARVTRTVMTGVRSRPPLTDGRPGCRLWTRSTISSTVASVKRLPSGRRTSSVSMSTSSPMGRACERLWVPPVVHGHHVDDEATVSPFGGDDLRLSASSVTSDPSDDDGLGDVVASMLGVTVSRRGGRWSELSGACSCLG